MPKTKLYHLHKIKIHPNRWLIWALAYGLIVALAVLSYIQVSNLNLESSLIAENNFKVWHEYTDHRLGFTFKFPSDWGIEADGPASITFSPSDSSLLGVSIHVLSLSDEKDLIKTLQIVSEQSVEVDGVKAREIKHDLGFNAIQTVIIVKKFQKLYVLSGPESNLRQILLTFRFLSSTK